MWEQVASGTGGAGDATNSQRVDVMTSVAESIALVLAPTEAKAAAAIQPNYVRRDRFIPVSRKALMQALAAPELWPGFDPAEVRTCFRYLAHWRHLAYADLGQELTETYLPFNPDRDIAETAIAPGSSDDRHKLAFIEAVRQMLERANYDEIPRQRLQAVLDEENPYGLELDVNLAEFEDIVIFVRGESTEQVEPDFLNRIRGKKAITLDVFQRVFLLIKLKPIETRVKEIVVAERVSEAKARRQALKLRKMLPPDVDDQHIFVKMFKEMLRPDLEIIFPNTRIKLGSRDKMTIGASAGGGIGMGVISTVTKIVAATLSPIGAALAILGLAGAASQQVAQVVHKRARYMLKVTRNLYFQNISNNQGALALLTERAEEEDIKEELLLYALLAKTSVQHQELGEAKAAIEQFLADEFKVEVEFDTEDALSRLLATGVVVEHADGMLVAMSPKTAATHIDEMWDVYLDKIGEREEQLEHPAR